MEKSSFQGLRLLFTSVTVRLLLSALGFLRCSSPAKEQQYCEISSWVPTLCPHPHSVSRAELRTARQSVSHSRGDWKSVTAVCLCKDMASV